MTGMQTDEQLLDKFVADGDEAAFTELTDRYRRRVLGAAIKQFRDPGTANDVVQQVFIQVFLNAASYDPRHSRFATWLFTIRENCFKDEHRRRFRRHKTNYQHNPNSLKRASCIFDHIPSREPPPDMASLQLEVFNRFWACFETLTLKQRLAVCLIYVQGLGNREAARQTGDHRTSIERRLAKALPRLKLHLGATLPIQVMPVLERRKLERAA
jgi:RNA polymerase sigma-70 factor (ECF subfamily)